MGTTGKRVGLPGTDPTAGSAEAVGSTSRAIAYLKADVTNTDGPALQLSQENSPVLHPFVDGLLVAYIVDAGNSYEFIQNRHVVRDGIAENQLRTNGLHNLVGLVNQRSLQVHPYANIFAVTMGGDFEASLLLLDGLWDEPLRQFVSGDYAAAVPARDILAFCDAGSTAGRTGLRELIDRVYPSGDHLLSNRLYLRRGGKWIAESLN
jgi:hypothetical protein